MSRGKKILVLVLGIIVIFGVCVWYILEYGTYINPASIFIEKADLQKDKIILTGNTTSSAVGFTGYDCRYEGTTLIVRLRYAPVSFLHNSGHFNIVIDLDGKLIDKVILEGNTKENHKKVL